MQPQEPPVNPVPGFDDFSQHREQVRSLESELAQTKRRNKRSREQSMAAERSEHGHKAGLIIGTLLVILVASILLGLIIKFWMWVL